MKRQTRAALVSGLLGMAAALAVIVAARIAGPATLRLQTAAADFVLLDEHGFKLGRAPAAHNILLVLFDERSAVKLGGLPSVEEDLELYRSLLDAGATAVGDTRMIAELGSPETTQARLLLAGMAQLDVSGWLRRDAWLAVDWPGELNRRYRPLAVHNVLNMHPTRCRG